MAGLDLNGAMLEGVGISAARELWLEVFVPDAREQIERGLNRRRTPTTGTSVKLRFAAIENLANVERFFFGGRFKASERGLDQILEFRQTRVGWSLELKSRGRVAIKTAQAPTIEYEAGEQRVAADDRPRSGPTGHGGGALRVLALRRAPGARS